MTRRAAILRLFAVTSVGMTLAACAPKAPLEQLLSDLEEAVEDRDVGAVAKLLAPGFQAQDGITAERVPEELRRYFFMYASIDAMISEVSAAGTPPSKVTLRADLSGKPKEIGALGAMLPSVAAFRFEFGLIERDGRLLIQSARWDRLDNPAP